MPRGATSRSPTAGAANARAYFEQIAEVFAGAVDSAGEVIERDYSVGHSRARLCFAGDALVPRMTPALEHLRNSSGPPAIEVRLFDSASTDTPLPFPSAQVRDVFEAGELWIYDDGLRRMLFDPVFRTLTMLDGERRLAFFWTVDAERLSYHETSFPLRSLWHWWLRPRGLQLCHAAAVANAQGAAVIAGPSGAGKSTAALACLSSPLRYLGDDFVILDTTGEPRVQSLYCSAKLHRDHLPRFALLRELVTNADRDDEEKALLFVDRFAAGKICLDAPALAVLFPHVEAKGTTRLEKLSPAEALRIMAVSTIFMLHGADSSDLEHFAGLLRVRPCFRLVLGAEVAEIPAVIGDLLETLA